MMDELGKKFAPVVLGISLFAPGCSQHHQQALKNEPAAVGYVEKGGDIFWIPRLSTGESAANGLAKLLADNPNSKIDDLIQTGREDWNGGLIVGLAKAEVPLSDRIEGISVKEGRGYIHKGSGVYWISRISVGENAATGLATLKKDLPNHDFVHIINVGRSDWNGGILVVAEAQTAR